MTTETQTTEQTQAPTPEAKTLSSPDLSFTEYETLRRGGKVTAEPAKTSAPEAKATEQKEATESETEATEEKEKEKPEEESSGEESEELDTAAKTDQEEQKPVKKKGGIQKRFDKLSKEKSEAQREAEYWRKAALDKGATDTRTAPVETKPAASETGKPKPEDFETHAAYVESLTDWKVDQKEKERTERENKSKAESEQSKKVQTYLDRKSAFAEKTPDFDDVIADVDDIRVSPIVSQLIIESEHGPELAYELAKNRAEYARICKLPDHLAAREIGKLEAKFDSKPSETKETKTVTQAPTPLTPVGTGKGSARKSIHDPDLPFTEYERMRREQMRRRRA